MLGACGEKDHCVAKKTAPVLQRVIRDLLKKGYAFLIAAAVVYTSRMDG